MINFNKQNSHRWIRDGEKKKVWSHAWKFPYWVVWQVFECKDVSPYKISHDSQIIALSAKFVEIGRTLKVGSWEI